jgi:ankyrin repeat protein
MSKKLNMVKKLVSLFCLGLSLMGSFSLEAASAPGKGRTKSLSPQEIFSILQTCDESNIQSMIREGRLDVVFQSSTGPQSILNILTFSGFTLAMKKRCMIARGLLDAGASSEEISEALVSAVVEGHTELVQTIFDHPNCFLHVDSIFPDNPQPTTLLLMAIQEGQLGVVKFLVERGADIHSRVGPRTPWMWARWSNQREIMRFLEARGAKTYRLIGSGLSQRFDVDYSSLKDLAAQSCAQDDGGSHDGGSRAVSGSAGGSKYLSGQDRVRAIHAMIAAAGNGDMENLQQILGQDSSLVDVVARDPISGGLKSPLLIAALRGDCEMLRYLFSKGARWDQELDLGEGKTTYFPLGVLERCSVEVMECLLEAGMPVDYQVCKTTLLLMATHLCRVDMVKLLLDNGAQQQRMPAAFAAAENGRADMVKLFRENDPSIIKRSLVQNGSYTTMLLSAIKGQQENMVFTLLMEGADFSYGAHGVCADLVEAKVQGNKRIIGLVEMYMKKRPFVRNQEAKPAPVLERERLVTLDTIARLEAQRASSLEAKDEELKKRQDRLQSAANLLQPSEKTQSVQDDSEKTESASASKKKKKKKKKKAVQEDNGGPAQVVKEQNTGAVLAAAELLEPESDDSAAWELCAQWVQEQEQERLVQEATDRSAELVRALLSFERGKSSTYAWPRDLILDKYVLVEEDEKEHGRLFNTVYDVLFNSSGKQRRVKAAPTSASSAKQPKAKNAGEQKQNKGQKNSGHNNGAGRKANKQKATGPRIPAQPGWERRVLNPAIAKAPSVYDRLQYAAGYVEDDGRPKQQVGNYGGQAGGGEDTQHGESDESRSSSPHENHDSVLSADDVRIIPGAAGEDVFFYEEARKRVNYAPEWPHAQDAVQLDDGGAVQAYGDGGEEYPGVLAQHAGELGAQDAHLAAPLVRILLYGGDEVVWHREHAVAIDLAHESGLHLDPDGALEIANNLVRYDGPISRERNGCYGLSILGKTQSMFPDSWTVQDLTNRFVHAIQTGNYTVTDEQYAAESGRTKTRTVLVGIMEPGDFLESERPVRFMARMVGNTNMIGTVFPITKNRYQQFAGAGHSTEEKEGQELDLNSWEADAQISGAEEYESIWD